MILLDATTKSLQVLLNAAVATVELPIVASYSDINQSTGAITATAGPTTVTTGVTAVTAAAAPGATTTRKVAFLSVYNADSASVIVTVRVNDNATMRILCRLTLGIGSTLIYADGLGFRVINNVGELLTALVRTAATTTYPLGGSKETGVLSASYTPVPTAQRVTIDGSLIAALGVSVRARLEMRTTDAATSVTMRVQNLTTAAAAGTSAVSTATDTAYNGVNQQQAVGLTIAAGSNVYELQIIGGNADTDVLGNGYLEVYVP